MAVAKSLDEAVTLAQKVLGKGAFVRSVPKIKPEKLEDDVEKARQKFAKARTVMGTEAKKLKDAIFDSMAGMRTNALLYSTAEFGLDKKSKGDADKIDKAHKIFKGFFDLDENGSKLALKEYQELQDHLQQLEKYKACL